MPLPDVNAYSAAFQHPRLCLSDTVLKECSIRTNQLGQPRVRSGGFALTYNLFSNKANWAVRCFHRDSPDRDRRYSAISRRLNSPDVRGSGYFVDFEFQPHGITMPDGAKFPIVKMAWAMGETMGGFLENRYADKAAIQNLRDSLAKLSAFLHMHNIAHGDIQPGNIMVSDIGRTVQLIDYDGIFVEEIRNLDAAEIGLPNFQHPERRTKTPWNVNLDNFSFIVIDVALSILQDNSLYWEQTQSGDDKILFSAQDYSAPEASDLFNELKRDSRYTSIIDKIQHICRLPFDEVPMLGELGQWKPPQSMRMAQTGSVTTIGYSSGYEVVDGLDINAIEAQVGNVAEVIGRVVEVKLKNTGPAHQNHPNSNYCFVSFAVWSPGVDRSFRLILWSGELERLAAKGISDVSSHFMGKYISIVGLIEKWETKIPEKIIPAKTIPGIPGRFPPKFFPERRFPERIARAYSICSDGTNVKIISQNEANFRLGRINRNLTAKHVTVASPSVQTLNASILDRIRKT